IQRTRICSEMRRAFKDVVLTRNRPKPYPITQDDFFRFSRQASRGAESDVSMLRPERGIVLFSVKTQRLHRSSYVLNHSRDEAQLLDAAQRNLQHYSNEIFSPRL